MGRDKARIELDGVPLAERVARALERVCGVVLLACGAERRYEDLGRPLVLDVQADLGPLAGLVAALEATRTEWLIALACDMPEADPQVLEELARFAQEGGWDVAMLATELGVEPLCAVYRATCLEPARAALQRAVERGTGARLTSFHSGGEGAGAPLRVAAMRPEHFSPGLRERAARSARNLNLPLDLARVTDGRDPGRPQR